MSQKLIFIAPGNSSHSLKWISSINNQSNYLISWVSFYGNENNIDDVTNYNFSKSITGILKCIRLIRTHDDAIVHIHSVGFHAFLFYIAKILKISNKIVTTPWGSDLIYGKESFFKRQLLKFLFKRSDLVTCDAFFIKNIVKELQNNTKVEIINFGVDTNKFPFFKREFHSGDKLKIISNRSLEDLYNIKSIIKSAQILNQRGINFELNIYAEGRLDKNLRRLVDEFNINSMVKFIGRYTQSDLVQILNDHHIYISMAHSDAGIASSTAEAMSTGMICCVSDVAENNIWIKNGITGFLVEDDNHIELAEIIERIYKKNIFPDEVSKNARRKIVKDNSIDGEMLKMVALYNALGKTIV